METSKSVYWLSLVFFTFFLAFCLMVPNSAFAGEYYVSPTGTATWPTCTSIGNPCRASNTDRAFLGASAGDTVYFLDGTYSGLVYNDSNYRTPAWNPSNSGVSGQPITFKSLNEHGAHLIGLYDGVGANVIGAYNKDYIVWDGFVVSAVDSIGNSVLAVTRFDSTNNSGLINSEVIGASHNTGGSINYEGIRAEDSTNLIFKNDYVHGFIETSNNHNTSGFKSYHTDTVTIENCKFTDNTVGIYMKGSGGTGNNNYIIRNNFVNNNHEGLLVGTKSSDSNNLKVYNNVISNSAYLNYDIDIDGSSTADNLMIYNNTFYGTGGPRWNVNTSGHGPTIYNNIFYATSTEQLSSKNEVAGAPTAVDHNLYYSGVKIIMRLYGTSQRSYSSLSGWQSSGELYGGGNPGTGSVQQNPDFANTSGTLTDLADFKVSNSLGRNGGMIGADVSTVGLLGSGGGNVAPSAPAPSPMLRIITQ